MKCDVFANDKRAKMGKKVLCWTPQGIDLYRRLSRGEESMCNNMSLGVQKKGLDNFSRCHGRNIVGREILKEGNAIPPSDVQTGPPRARHPQAARRQSVVGFQPESAQGRSDAVEISLSELNLLPQLPLGRHVVRCSS